MRTIHVDLQEGFEHDDVVVRADGREVFRREDVRTRTQIGLAVSFEFETGEQPLTLEVECPSRELRRSRRLDPTRESNVGVSLEGGEIVIEARSEPYGYV